MSQPRPPPTPSISAPLETGLQLSDSARRSHSSPLPSPPAPRSTTAPSPHPATTLQLTTPPLTLTDPSTSQRLTLYTSVYVRPPATPQNYTHLHLFRLPHFHLSVYAPSSVAHLISRAPLWHQLGLRPQLCGESKILLLREVAGNVEEVLARTLPSAGVERIELRIEMEGGVGRGLLDVAVRSFWGDKMARLVPMLGRVGLVQELGKRAEYVKLVAGIMERFRPEDTQEGEVERRLWWMLLRRVKATEPMMGLGEETGEEMLFDVVSEDDMLWDESEDELLLDQEEWSQDIISDSEDEVWAELEAGQEPAWTALETQEDISEDEIDISELL